MTKRTRSEFERVVPTSDIEDAVVASTSEVESAVAEGGWKEFPLTVGAPNHSITTHDTTDVAIANGAVTEILVEEVYTATWVTDEGLEGHPLWALLGRAGYTLW